MSNTPLENANLGIYDEEGFAGNGITVLKYANELIVYVTFWQNNVTVDYLPMTISGFDNTVPPSQTAA